MAKSAPTSKRFFDADELTRLVDAQPKWKGKVYAAAVWYSEQQIPIIPVEYGEKTLPLAQTYQKRGYKDFRYDRASTARDVIDLWFNPTDGQFAGFNIGIACGPSICAIDLDIGDGKNGFGNYTTNIAKIDGSTPVALTPSGGNHLLFLGSPDVKSGTSVLGYSGIDVRGSRADGITGSHIVVYPSVRRQSDEVELKGYVWINGGDLVPPPEVFTKVIPIGSGKVRGSENVGADDEYPNPTIEDVVQALRFLSSDIPYQDWVNIGMSIHSMFPNDDGFASWIEWSATATDRYPGDRDCWSKWQSFGGTGITINTLFKAAVNAGYRQKQNFTPELVLELRYGSKGQVLQTNHNLHVILSSQDFKEEYDGALQYDTFTDIVAVGDKVFLNEAYTNVSAWLSTKFGFERGKDSVRDFARMVARYNETDSLKSWAETLVWDGEDRLNQLGGIICAKNDYQIAAIKRWLIGGIARAYQPGCTATHMLILFGKQGIGKSRFFRHLTPNPAWFTDSPTFKFSRDTSHRDEEIKLQGKWIIEVPELAGIWKSDFNDLKNFLTLQAPVIRRPYDPDSVTLPRRCIFGGTTNMDSVINDPTGGRRFAFLSLDDHKIDIEWVDANRDQIWAQAKSWYQAHEPWWFNDTEYLQQISDNKNFEREHPWYEAIGDWASDKSRFTSQDVYEFVLKKITGNQTQKDAGDVKTILESLGYKRMTVRFENGKTSKAWVNPNQEVESRFTGRRWGIEV